MYIAFDWLIKCTHCTVTVFNKNICQERFKEVLLLISIDEQCINITVSVICCYSYRVLFSVCTDKFCYVAIHNSSAVYSYNCICVIYRHIKRKILNCVSIYNSRWISVCYINCFTVYGQIIKCGGWLTDDCQWVSLFSLRIVSCFYDNRCYRFRDCHCVSTMYIDICSVIFRCCIYRNLIDTAINVSIVVYVTSCEVSCKFYILTAGCHCQVFQINRFNRIVSTSVNCKWVYACRIICYLRWIYHKDYCWILSCRCCYIKCSVMIIYNVWCRWYRCNNRNIILCFFYKVCEQFFSINFNRINIERHCYIIVMYRRIKYRSHSTLINCKIIKFGDCIIRSYNIYNIMYSRLRCLNCHITVALYIINFWCKNYIKIVCTTF